MADGKNEARALRIMEIINDCRALQTHITSLTTRSPPPDAQSAALAGYVVMKQCAAEEKSLAARPFNPNNVASNPGQIPDTEEQKAALQRLVLDASARRFQAHKIYLRTAAAMRWIQARQQILVARPNPAALQAVDQRLREEIVAITDQQVFNDLREKDRRQGFWIVEDPSLERLLAWIRRQQ